MANNTTQNGMYCAFCGKPKELANKLVAGPIIYCESQYCLIEIFR